MPAPSRRRAKTSFHAVFLVVRATAAHSNPPESPFNFIPREGRQRRRRKRRTPNAELQNLGDKFSSFGIRCSALGVRRFLPFLQRFPSCAPRRSTLTVPNLMRSILRRAGLTLSAGLLIFCCSCERHHVGELPAEHETKGAEKHAVGPHAPEPRMTPANFFPENTPH